MAETGRPLRAAVIGSGFGGIAAAIRLAAAGVKVTLFEARDQPGGRAYVYREGGYTFDAGPTVITAPHCIEELFELAGKRMLLVGDAESGPRKDPSYPVGDVEEFLIEHHKDAIRSDILQVGHHGSKTSSRREFLEAVKPSLALLSTGPKKYGTVTLPDVEVLDELTRVGAKILRTDERDGDCPITGRIGGDKGPGGCDAWVITIGP